MPPGSPGVRSRDSGWTPTQACARTGTRISTLCVRASDLAARPWRGGPPIFERSPVTALEATTRGAKVVCGKTVLTAGTVVLATGEPVPPFGALERHFDSLDAYAVLTPPLAAGVQEGRRGPRRSRAGPDCRRP